MSNLYRNNQDQYQQVERIVNNLLGSVNTNLLVEVKAIDGVKLTVQPTGKRFYKNNNLQQETKDYGEFEVNVLQLNNITVTINVGDIGFLIVNQYDIGNILSGETLVPRRFDLLDGLFFPVNITSTAISTEDVEIRVPRDIQLTAVRNVEIVAKTLDTECTETQIKNPAGDSLIQVLIDVLKVIDNLVTQSGDVLNAATKAAIQTEVAKLTAFNP
jgi:hypothetical protein